MPTKSPDETCVVCLAFPGVFRRLRSEWEYKGKVKSAITAMKYRPSIRLCRTLGASLGDFARQAVWQMDWDAIVPIPSSPSSLSNRGFNQSLLLAEEVALKLGPFRKIPVINALSYRGKHRRQATVAMGSRLENARRMFLPVKEIENQKILIVDDVLTSGATATEAAKALIHAGALAVDLLTLARSPAWQRFRRLSAYETDPNNLLENYE